MRWWMQDSMRRWMQDSMVGTAIINRMLALLEGNLMQTVWDGECEILWWDYENLNCDIFYI